MENRINKIMELADGSKYIIVKQAIYKNESYYVAAKLDENEMVDAQLLDNNSAKVFREILTDGNASVEEVTDPKLFELIVKYVGL